VITVPTTLHQRLKYAERLPLFAMIAKNVELGRGHHVALDCVFAHGDSTAFDLVPALASRTEKRSVSPDKLVSVQPITGSRVQKTVAAGNSSAPKFYG